MVHWSLVPRPPHVTLCQPRTYLHIVKCYPWHWTHETGNTNVITIISRKRRDGPSPLGAPIVAIVLVILTNFKERPGQRRTVTAWAGPELSLRLRSLWQWDTMKEILRRRAVIDTALSPRVSPGSMSWHSHVLITSDSPPVAVAHSNKYKNIKD